MREEVSRSRNVAAKKGHAIAQYLIHSPATRWIRSMRRRCLDVAKAAHAVCQKAINGGVYVLAGQPEDQPASIVATDGRSQRPPRLPASD